MNIPSHIIQQVTRDVQAITTEIERITGLQSRWTGNVRLPAANDPNYLTAAGRKEWNCDISIRQDYVTSVHYFHVCLHEVLHGVSRNLTPMNYILCRGYEEGVIEQCTRLLSNEIGSVLTMSASGGYGAYLPEIHLPKDLRSHSSKMEREFYLDLLATSLDRREMTVVHWIGLAHPQKSRQQIIQEISPILQGLH